VHYRDQPGFNLPMAVGAGRLTETRGEDRFITSLAVQRAANLVHLRSSSWSVPWSLSIGAGRRGSGSGVASSAIRFGAPTTTGPIAVASERDWLAFASVAAAMTAPAHLLMTNLIPARDNDRTAWSHIADALARLNPRFRIRLTVVDAAAWLGNDDFEVVAQGHYRVRLGPFSMGDGDSRSLSLPLLALFDPRRIRSGDALNFRLVGAGTPLPRMSWSYPYNDQPTPARFTRGNGGHYTMTGRFR
jgi:hypothetical protein